MEVKSTLLSRGKQINNEYLGFNPTSNSTKPAYIANGIFRNCIHEYCHSKELHNWLVAETKKGALSSEDLIKEYHKLFAAGEDVDIKQVRIFRFFLQNLLANEGTIFPSYEKSVPTITSHWLIKCKNQAEGGIGEFINRILTRPLEEGRVSSALELMTAALKNDSDDITRLVMPIIGLPTESTRRNLGDGISLSFDKLKWNSMLETIRKGFDRLADNIRYIGEANNSLLVLERMINFSMLAVYLYLVHVNTAMYSGASVPLLIDSNMGLDAIKKASEQSFTAAKRSVEEFYVNAINELLMTEVQATEQACLKYIHAMTFDNNEDEVQVALVNYFKNAVKNDAPLMALAKTLQWGLYDYGYDKTTTPSDFCRVIGRHGGIIGPLGNRATSKRYMLNSFTLENIILSIMDQDELDSGLELSVMGERLRNCYNIVLGTDSELEYELLKRSNIAQSTPGDLRGELSLNAQEIANKCVDLGWGKRYADGVTLIGWRL